MKQKIALAGLGSNARLFVAHDPTTDGFAQDPAPATDPSGPRRGFVDVAAGDPHAPLSFTHPELVDWLIARSVW